MNKKFDLIVLGFGKGGKTLAVYYANKGKKVALIEKSPKMFGGTCINIGCIPTKTLIVASEHCKTYKEAKAIRDNIVSKLNAKNEAMIKNAGVELIVGHGKFINNKTIEVLDDNNKAICTLESDFIAINTGATPFVPKIPGIRSDLVFDSTKFQGLEDLPKRVGILGCGAIGLEFASLIAGFGVAVDVVGITNLLPREEPEISDLIKQYLEDAGVKFHLNEDVKNIISQDKSVVLETSNKTLEFDILIQATTRIPAIEGIGLENTDIITEKGAIKVDDFCQTNVEGIFALGDVNGGMQTTYASLDDFRILKSSSEA